MNSRKLILATLFGAIIFAFETILPSPMDKAFVFFQASLLSLGYLLLGVLGATYVSMVGGLLTALWRAPFALFTITFALLYGLLIDAISSIIKVRSVNNDVKVKRLIMAVTVSTIIVGLASYYTSVIFKLLPRNPPAGNRNFSCWYPERASRRICVCHHLEEDTQAKYSHEMHASKKS